MSLASGVRLGAYQLVAPVGAGGMGEVFRATDTKLEHEAELLASLNHPNIAHLYGFESAIRRWFDTRPGASGRVEGPCGPTG